jgi:hypothetical protein
LIWQEHSFAASLAVCWEPGYEEVWIVISDLPARRKLIKIYGWRMRVEATFQDTKSRGWQIECSATSLVSHLNRHLMVLFLAVWWVAHLGSACMNHGHRSRFDRVDRRDKGLFRLGRLYLRFLLAQSKHKQPEVRAPHLASCLAVRTMGMRHSRSIGQEKTHLQHVATAAALNLVRSMAWFDGLPRAQTRRSAFARLYDAA